LIDTELAAFDPDLAEAVVQVLRRHGVQAWLADAPARAAAGGSERAVHVRPEQREPALGLLAEHMEEVGAELDGSDGDDADVPLHGGGRPLVMERFRRIGLNLAIVLAPLLIISLARPPFPLGLTLVTLVGGMAVIVALRNRHAGGEDR